VFITSLLVLLKKQAPFRWQTLENYRDAQSVSPGALLKVRPTTTVPH
jgi:hypothetical protein